MAPTVAEAHTSDQAFVTFDGWDGIEPDGKAEFTPDSTCPPDRDGLGWQINRYG